MASVNAIQNTFPSRSGRDEAGYFWSVGFECALMDATGSYFDVVVKVRVDIGDSAAVVKTKIQNALATAVAAHTPGNTLSAVHVFELTRWV
jgi:hypothetical protein